MIRVIRERFIAVGSTQEARVVVLEECEVDEACDIEALIESWVALSRTFEAIGVLEVRSISWRGRR